MRFINLKVAALLAIAFLAGCSGVPQMDYDKVTLIAAHGKITLDGQPLPRCRRDLRVRRIHSSRME